MLDDSGSARETFGEIGVAGGVLGGEFLDVGDGALRVGVKRERAAIGIGRENAHRRFQFLQTVARELHVFQDGRERRASGMRDGGTAETGMKFFGDGAAADDLAAFENERLQAFLREIEGGDERVVPAANDQDFARRGHG